MRKLSEMWKRFMARNQLELPDEVEQRQKKSRIKPFCNCVVNSSKRLMPTSAKTGWLLGWL